MGRVAALSTARSALTYLQHRMIGLGRALATAAVALCAIVPALGLARGQSAELMVITADDRPQRAHPAAARDRDPGFGYCPGYRQDRDPDRGTMVARRLWTPVARRRSAVTVAARTPRCSGTASLWTPPPAPASRGCFRPLPCATTLRCARRRGGRGW